MMRRSIGAVVSAAVLCAVAMSVGAEAASSPSPAPSPSPSPSAAPARRATLTVTCQTAPFYVFSDDVNRPTRARTQRALLGQRFDLVSGPRTTLQSGEFYETNVIVVEPGYAPGSHYWLSSVCANVT